MFLLVWGKREKTILEQLTRGVQKHFVVGFNLARGGGHARAKMSPV